MSKSRKKEAIGTGVRLVTGAIAGAKLRAVLGIATGGVAMAATVPLGIIGGVLVGLIGNKIGSELDRHEDD